MHRLLSPFILEKYAAGESSGQFDAATLFVDVSGFSAMTSTLMTHGQHGAEVMAHVMRAVFDPLVEAVYAHGGFITVFAGDAFTAVFPVGAQGLAHLLPPPLHALTAAWAIRRHMATHAHHETPYGAFEVGVKLGLAFGTVQWGILRSQDEKRAASYFRGPAIDGCAEAEHHAQPGDIILHASVVGTLHDAVESEEAGDGRRVTGIATTLPDPQPVTRDPLALDLQERFFPRGIIEQTHSGEFRQVLNVFINVRGDPDEAQIAQLMSTVFELQNKYGGLLNRIDFGDKGCSLLLFWGAPIAHENDLARALNFLLALHEQTRIPIRAGVTSRIAHAGFIGSDLHAEYTCYGNGVNLAARLMTSAPWESIWVDEEVRLRAEYQFEMEPEGAQMFKGFAEPQPVYTLLGYQAAEVLRFYERPMVGRSDEVAQLGAFVRPLFLPSADQRFAGILVISGEVGIGKSRLVYEFRNSELGPTITELPHPKWLVAQADQILRLPLNPFIYWLREYFGQSSTQSEAYNRRVFSRNLNRLLSDVPDPALSAEIERTHSMLGALLELEWEDSLYSQLDPQSRHESTLSALKNLIVAESLRQPVILLLEDVQWLDDDSIEFIQRLTRNIEPYPIAILATARPEPDRRLFGSGVEYQTLELNTLPVEAIAQLATEVLGTPPSPELATLLNQRAGGNPFFAEQILLYLREEGLLDESEGTWMVETGEAASLLPGNVRAIFIARLDRLSHDVREAVQSAAILGREFEVQVLTAMLERLSARGPRWTSDIWSCVYGAEQAAIWSQLGELRYLFKHVLLRDAAYDVQVQTRRAALHQLAGEALETLHRKDLNAHLGELAYHFEAAWRLGETDVAAKARDYVIRAAKAAVEKYENTAAIDYYTRALALTPDDDLRGRFDLLLARSKVYDTRGEREAERQDLLTMEQLADALDDDSLRAETALRWANHHEETAQFQAGIAAVERALTLAGSLVDIDQQLRAMYLQGSLLYRVADYDAAAVTCEDGIALAREHKLSLAEADLLAVLSFTLDARGESQKALDALQRALAVYQAAGDSAGVMATLNSIAIAEYGMGRYAEAGVYFDEAIRLARETGRRKSEARYLGNIGQLTIALGDLRKAQSTLERALYLNREIGNRDSEAINLGNLGVVATKRGDFDAAQDLLARSVAIAKEINDPLLVCESLAYWGLCDLHRGDLDAAMQHCGEALPLARALSSPMHEGLILMTQGHAHLAAGDAEQALAAYQSSLAVRGDASVLGYAAEAHAGQARAYLALGNQADALEQVEPVAEFITAQGPATTHGIVGAEDGLWIYLTCYQVLAAVGDARAEALLRRTHDLLQAEVAQFGSEAESAQYIERIAYRREIIARYRQLEGIVEPEAAQPVALRPLPDDIDLDSGELSRLDLSYVDLRGVSLRGADLSNANLRGADFSGADLRRADLTGADVRGANFNAADLRGADLTDIVFDNDTLWPEGFTP